MTQVQYVVIDDADWGETTVLTQHQWPTVRQQLLDDWEVTLDEAGGDPARPLEDYVEEHNGDCEHIRHAAAICSDRAAQELRRLCRQFTKE